MDAGAEPARLLTSVTTAARLCATTVDGLPSTARGFHPFGASDPSGFAAMACDEILVHTYDASTALGDPFLPPPGLARATLARLFPQHAPHPDPWETLLWANGRMDHSHAPRQHAWRWHTAPLEESAVESAR